MIQTQTDTIYSKAKLPTLRTIPGSETARITPQAARTCSTLLTMAALNPLATHGKDQITEAARKQIIHSLGLTSSADVFFFATGTAANSFAVMPFAPPRTSLLIPEDGHMATLEASALETMANVHAIRVPVSPSGKLTIQDLETAYHPKRGVHENQNPLIKGVFITVPTEKGVTYSPQELRALSTWCRSKGLFFGADGARLPYYLEALRTEDSKILECFDVITLSATKLGRTLGAATVFRERLTGEKRRIFDLACKTYGHDTDATWILSAGFQKELCPQTAGAVNMAQHIATLLKRSGHAVTQNLNLVFIRLSLNDAEAFLKAIPSAYRWELDSGTIITAEKRYETSTVRVAISPAFTQRHSRMLVHFLNRLTPLERVMNSFPSREAQDAYKCEEAAGASAQATYQVVEHSRLG